MEDDLIAGDKRNKICNICGSTSFGAESQLLVFMRNRIEDGSGFGTVLRKLLFFSQNLHILTFGLMILFGYVGPFFN